MAINIQFRGDTGHGATVEMWLLQGDQRYEVAQMGPDFLILRLDQNSPNLGECTVAIRVDDGPPHWMPCEIGAIKGRRLEAQGIERWEQP